MTSKRVRGAPYDIRLDSKDWGPKALFRVWSGDEQEAQVWSQGAMAMVAAEPGASLTRRLKAAVRAIVERCAEWEFVCLQDTRPLDLCPDRVGPDDYRWGLREGR